MSALERSSLSKAEARSLTDEIKLDAERLWGKLLEAYEGGAHLSLGYNSWGSYFEAEFGGSDATAYRLLQSGRAMAQLPIGSPRPKNEAQARELAPLLDNPDQLREAWAEVVDLKSEPTAADVREVVQRRTGMDVHYSSSSDQWSTPQDLFDELDREFGFTLDVCATAENAKCKSFYDRERDGLQQAWEGVCWMNPPYGNEIGDWVRKARESAEAGATVVCLVPARTDTGWWWNHCRSGEVRFLRGRLRFGGSETGAPFPSAVVVFGRKPTMFCWERVAA